MAACLPSQRINPLRVFAVHVRQKLPGTKGFSPYMYGIAFIFKTRAFFDHFSCLACAATLREYVEFFSCADVSPMYFSFASQNGAPAIARPSERVRGAAGLKCAPFSIISLALYVLPRFGNTWNFFHAPMSLRCCFFYASQNGAPRAGYRLRNRARPRRSWFQTRAFFDHFSCLECAATLREYVEFF